jgi:hypothetical protein
MDSSSVAITIPVHRDQLDKLEELSLARCVEVLGRHHLVFVGPESLDFEPYLSRAGHADVVRFPDRYFRSYVGYNELMLSRDFYARFRDFSHILIYQLDAFVFRDTLADWCERGFDYVAAPWLNHSGSGWFGVGNGGLCLRSVRGCLAVFDSTQRESAADYWQFIRSDTPSLRSRARYLPWKLACHLGLGHTSRSYLRRFIARLDPGLTEDFFWGLHAPRFCPEFRVAPIEEAFQFSIEGGLERAWELGYFGGSPPFGCHRVRYLRWIHRFLNGEGPAESEAETIVWKWAEMVGLERVEGVESERGGPSRREYSPETAEGLPANPRT